MRTLLLLRQIILRYYYFWHDADKKRRLADKRAGITCYDKTLNDSGASVTTELSSIEDTCIVFAIFYLYHGTFRKACICTCIFDISIEVSCILTYKIHLWQSPGSHSELLRLAMEWQLKFILRDGSFMLTYFYKNKPRLRQLDVVCTGISFVREMFYKLFLL